MRKLSQVRRWKKAPQLLEPGSVGHIISTFFLMSCILCAALSLWGCSEAEDKVVTAPEDKLPSVKEPLKQYHPVEILTTELRSAPMLAQKTHPNGWKQSDCTRCHQSPSEVTSEVCADCHGVNGINDQVDTCSSCHKVQSEFGEPASGSHQAHILKSPRDTGCVKCHTGGPEQSNSHANGEIDIKLADSGKYTPMAQENGVIGSCSSIVCHQDVRKWGGDCSSCHYNPPDTGHHKKHLDQADISCQSCHSESQHDSDKTSGEIELGGIEYDSSTGDCASTCHNEQVSWTCSDCHAYPPDTGNHTAKGHEESCEECHSDHSHSYIAATRPLDFSNVTVNIIQRGIYRDDTQMCSSVVCHGDDRVWGSSCTDCHDSPPDTGAHGLHVQQQDLECQDCHSDNQHDLDNSSGSIELGGITYEPVTGDCTSTCHGEEQWDCTSCHSFPPDSGNHLAHNGDCGECHQEHQHSYKAATQPEDFTNTQVKIADGGQFNPTNRACSGLSCHESRTWGSSCTDCHSNPPDTGTHILHVQQRNLKCQDCHSDNQHDSNNQSGFIELGGVGYNLITGDCTSTCHVERKWSCEDCHSFPPDSGNHLAHNGDCGECHQGHQHSYKAATQPEDFTNTQVKIADGGQFNPTNGACSGLSCHESRTWGSSCTDCHSNPPETGVHLLHVQDQKLSCQDCHDGNQHDANIQSGSIELGGIGYNTATGDCTSTCHAERKWSCTDCHNNPPDTGNHPDHKLSCEQCHQNHQHSYRAAMTPEDLSTVSTDFAVGGDFDSQSSTCSSIECHPDQRVWGTDCSACHSSPPTTGTHVLHVEQGKVKCYDCHEEYQHDLDVNSGSIELGGIEYNSLTGNCLSTCHVEKKWNCLDCHSNPPDTGAHKSHNEPSGKFFAGDPIPTPCSECHLDHEHSYKAAMSPEELFPIQVEFAQSGVFSPATGVCNNLACHGAIKWNNTCGDCHGAPPETGVHQTHIGAGLNCTQCHEENQHDLDVNSGLIEVGGTASALEYEKETGGCTSSCHTRKELWDCTSCHGYPPDADQHKSHELFGCNFCHKEHEHTYKAATAPEDFGDVTVDFTIGGDWSKALRTCSSVICHADRQW